MKTKAKKLPDVEILRKLIDYDPRTGVARWKPRPESMFSCGARTPAQKANAWNARFAGSELSWVLTGYRAAEIDGATYLVHRLVWKIMTGEEPPEFIDHINGVRDDNRWENLRAATRQQNNRNARRRKDNRSGVSGVQWHKASAKWQAAIGSGATRSFLGVYDNIEDAIAARKCAETRLGFHRNHGVDARAAE